MDLDIEKILKKLGPCPIAEFIQKDTVSFSKISLFAKKIIEEQTTIPEEFDKFFQENFWDLLA